MTQREFLRSTGLLTLYFWILTSSIGCFFRHLPESSSDEVTPVPATVEKTPASSPKEQPPESLQENMVEARYWQKLNGDNVECHLCFRKCNISEGGRGLCLARTNYGGKLYTLTYGRPVAMHIDPVEKEPLFHMEPGSDTLCVGTATCNLRCKNCINWHIAQQAPEEVEAVPMTSEEVVHSCY